MTRNSTIIAPSILSADLGKLREELVNMEAAGADWIHIDVMDGSFVPPITFGANVVQVVAQSCSLVKDVHLMVERPESHIESFIIAGAEYVTVHQETSPHLHRTLSEIKRLGAKAGVSINPSTPVESLIDSLELCDLILIMSVNPGWGGQKFIPSSLKKINRLKEILVSMNLNTRISVDGGIDATTSKDCINAGADILVSGSFLFNSSDKIAAIRSLRS